MFSRQTSRCWSYRQSATGECTCSRCERLIVELVFVAPPSKRKLRAPRLQDRLSVQSEELLLFGCSSRALWFVSLLCTGNTHACTHTLVKRGTGNHVKLRFAACMQFSSDITALFPQPDLNSYRKHQVTRIKPGHKVESCSIRAQIKTTS